MRFLTPIECAAWCAQQRVELDEKQLPLREPAKPHCLRYSFPESRPFGFALWLSRCVESALQPRRDCLLWITDWGIFPSNENQHIYYRLRQSYGDFRLLHEAPGHLCLEYERAEVVTLVQLCVLFGWDVHLIPVAGFARAFICHDEWAVIGFDDEATCQQTRQALKS